MTVKLSRRQFGFIAAAVAARPSLGAPSDPTELAQDVPLQPFAAQAARIVAALQALGEPLSSAETASLDRAANETEGPLGTAAIQTIFDRRALMIVTINPESRLSVARGPAPAELLQSGWRAFLIKIINQAGVTSPFLIRSPQAGKTGRTSSLAITGVHDFTNGAVDAVEARRRWIALAMYDLPPMTPKLSGLEVEYRILQIYSRDAGRREASLTADCGFGDDDLGFRSTLPVLFYCAPAHAIRFNSKDENGTPCVASLLVRDRQKRIYPAQGKREVPDLSFQPQIYRANGETLLLGAGNYAVTISRGPEYIPELRTVNLTGPSTLSANLRRWITPSQHGYYSGDTHIHAAGCSHYESPTEGVTPEVMERQASGEALDLASVLNWGPGFAYQKQFFSGHVRPATNAASPEALLRYDVEVSGFPSSHCGHLVLLRLKEDGFPGAQCIDEWPSWNLPILRWAKAQGAITGYAHSGHGMVTRSTALPNYEMPPFDSSGTNEFLVDVTHPDTVDFLSGCDTMPFAELNAWYHTLNCGYRTAFAGETDFPCLTDQCVGGGRSYVKLPQQPKGDNGYSAWLIGLTHGKGYAGDGRSHIFDFDLEHGNGVSISAQVAALLPATPDEDEQRIALSSPYTKPYWHLERARIGKGRRVLVELVVNGQVDQSRQIEADGTLHSVSFTHRPQLSSWYALRIYPSAHTQPIFVELEGKPVRASRRSAEWCRQAIDALWSEKKLRIRPAEMKAAATDYNHARLAYENIMQEAAEE